MAVKRRFTIAIAIACITSMFYMLTREEIFSIPYNFKSEQKRIPFNHNPKNLENEEFRKKEKLVETPDPMTLNNTRKAQIDLIVFNRVPKVGSKMLAGLLELLGKRNNFSVAFQQRRGNTEKMLLSTLKQKSLSDFIFNLPIPATFTKHFPYIDFEKYDKPKTIYINMVRDPVERIISRFHFVRSAKYITRYKMENPTHPDPDPEFLKKDFAACVLNQDPECSFIEGDKNNFTYEHGQMTYFCGNDPECLPFNTQGLLDKAKHHLENEYAVVGVLEDLNTTLAVFEKFVPKFFAGATEVYLESYNDLRQINQNSDKPEIAPEIKDLIRKNLSREYEFFEFCKKRLNLQFLASVK